MTIFKGLLDRFRRVPKFPDAGTYEAKADMMAVTLKFGDVLKQQSGRSMLDRTIYQSIAIRDADAKIRLNASCATCHHFSRNQSARRKGGVCRVAPPVAGTGWPLVDMNDRCGVWVPDPDRTKAKRDEIIARYMAKYDEARKE